MPDPVLLTQAQARALTLDAQGLLDPAPFGKGLEGALKALEHLGYVQIDTIAVIERAHHHVLRTRVPDYEPAHLEELLSRKRQIFEYWSHAAAYLPTSDFRYSLPRKQAYADGKRHWFRKNRRHMQEVLARIKREGPLSAKDFEAPKNRRGGPWFEWKPAKVALELLFMEGRLMVAGRRNFQKVYDLTERVLASSTNAQPPSPEELGRHLVLSGLRAHGLMREREMAYLRRSEARNVKRALQELLAAGHIREVRIAGSPDSWYALSEGPELAERALKKVSRPENRSRVHLLSPFDNLVIQRKRLSDLFGFDYQIECYLPEPKRKYGYFVLPILWQDRFVGRLDPKADRQTKVLRVRSLHLEKSAPAIEDWAPALGKSLREFARFNGCDEVVFEGAARKLAKNAGLT